MNSTMRTLEAPVRGGRLLLDEVLAGSRDYLDPEERERLHESIDRGIEDVRAGRTTDARQAMDALRARASDR